MKNIFILDATPTLSSIIKEELELTSTCKVSCFNNQPDFLKALYQTPDIIIIDPEINTENSEFLLFFNKIRRSSPAAKIILFSNLSNLKLGLELIKKGAVNYINKKDKTYLQEIKKSINIISKIKENNQKIEDVNQKLTSLKKNITIYAMVTITLVCLFYFL